MKKRPNRQSHRLKRYDYSQEGAYYITINCHDKICRFGEIVNGKMVLNECGEAAYNLWFFLPERYEGIALGEFVIMPNHMHGILVFDDEMGRNPARAWEINSSLAASIPVVNRTPLPNHTWPTMRDIPKPRPSRILGDVIGGYKSLVANACLELYKTKNECMGKLWQRNYWEQLIRDEQGFINITHYIIANVKNWRKDEFYKG